MKKIISLYSLLLTVSFGFAQSPNTMSYQAIIRNSSNLLISNSTIGMQISIIQGSVSGAEVYKETHSPTTNSNGLVGVEIGGGTIVSGNFATIDWSNGPYFVKTETDPNGGTSYTVTGTTQLLSVPYALHARSTDSWTVNGDTSFSKKKVLIGANSSSGYGSPHVPLKIIGFDPTNAASKTRMQIFRVDPSFGGAVLALCSADGTTLQNPQAVQANRTLGAIGFGGYNGTSFPDASALILSKATENYSLTGLGSALSFQTTSNGSTTRVTRMSITEEGSIIYHPLNSAPSTPIKGETYFDNSLNKLRVWDGTAWKNCW